MLELGRERPEVVVLSADLSKYTDVRPVRRRRFPSRFFQVGMAEQNMMGIAGGLAKTGFLPVAVTYAVFATRRAGDQVQMALSTGATRRWWPRSCPASPPRSGPATRATDDLAIMRAVPGMTVIDPIDATELSRPRSAPP